MFYKIFMSLLGVCCDINNNNNNNNNIIIIIIYLLVRITRILDLSIAPQSCSFLTLSNQVGINILVDGLWKRVLFEQKNDKFMK